MNRAFFAKKTVDCRYGYTEAFKIAHALKTYLCFIGTSVEEYCSRVIRNYWNVRITKEAENGAGILSE